MPEVELQIVQGVVRLAGNVVLPILQSLSCIQIVTISVLNLQKFALVGLIHLLLSAVLIQFLRIRLAEPDRLAREVLIQGCLIIDYAPHTIQLVRVQGVLNLRLELAGFVRAVAWLNEGCALLGRVVFHVH